MGARLLTEDEVDAPRRRVAFDADGSDRAARARPVVRQPRARSPASRCATDDKVLLAPLPSDLDELAGHPLRAREADAGARPRALAVGRARARRLRAGHRARRPRPHLGGLRDATRTSSSASPSAIRTGPHPRQRADRRRRARRRLQLDDADLLARLRHLGRLDHDRQRQLPQPAERQDGVAPPGARRSGSACPSDTYFNAGALENLRQLQRATRC